MRLRQSDVLSQLLLIAVMLILGSIANIGLAAGHVSLKQGILETAIAPDTTSSKKATVTVLADNVYYDEELLLEIWRDGSVKSLWTLRDAGNNLLGFPTTLPLPLNSSYPGVGDMRIDFMVSEVPQLSAEWGLMVDYDRFADDYSYPNDEAFYGDADYASFSSNELLITFRAWNQTTNDTGVVDDGLNDTQQIINDVIDDLSAALGTDFHLMINRTGAGREFQYDYGLEQSWRGFLFDMNETWYRLFSLLPLDEGLTQTTTSRLMEADARSLYISAEWDENADREGGLDSDEEDERWEFETTFGILERSKLTLNTTSNQLYLNELIDFTQIQYSHPKANASSIAVRLPYGSRIVAIEPFDAANRNDVCYFELDLINNHNKRITEYDSVTFVLDALPMPSLIVHATTNVTVVSPGDVVQIDYNITNIGSTPAYNVQFWGFGNTTGAAGDEWNFLNVTEQNANYSFWDPGTGEAFYNFAQINASESVFHSVFLNATPPSAYFDEDFVKTCEVIYDSVDDPAASSFVGWSAVGLQNDGNELHFWYNHTDAGASFDLNVMTSRSVVRIGETLTVIVNVTNTGNTTATNIQWEAPVFGFNTSNRDGIIASLDPGNSTVVITNYLLDVATIYTDVYGRDDYPARQLGETLELDWYIDFYTDSRGAQTSNVDGSELRIDVLPASNQSFGPFLDLDIEYTPVTYSAEEFVTISVVVENVGDMNAENVVITSEFSEFEFEFFAGAGTISPPTSTLARRFSYVWGDLPAGDSFSFSFKLKAQTAAESFAYTYAMCDWVDGLTRTFHPRTNDWEAPILTGPEALEIVKNEFTAITASLNWSVSDEHAGTYRLLQANSSVAIASTNASSLAAANLTFNEIGSGRWTNASWEVSHSLAGLGDGFYLFTIEVIDCCGNRANHSVAVSIRTILTPEEEDGGGLFEDINDYLSENSTFLMIIGALTIIAIAEGVIIYFMRHD